MYMILKVKGASTNLTSCGIHSYTLVSIIFNRSIMFFDLKNVLVLYSVKAPFMPCMWGKFICDP